jgi:hypothetical protein
MFLMRSACNSVRGSQMRLLLFVLSFVLLTACGPDDPEHIPERIKERCQREFGTQGQRVVNDCIRWSEVPPTSR